MKQPPTSIPLVRHRMVGLLSAGVLLDNLLLPIGLLLHGLLQLAGVEPPVGVTLGGPPVGHLPRLAALIASQRSPPGNPNPNREWIAIWFGSREVNNYLFIDVRK